ncbi:MAG: hypothetical protein AAFQ17_06245, partial [Pseudomonadota bacterium]
NSAANSVNTYGGRLTGTQPINDDVKLGYALSYAFQTDAGDNASDFDAHYAAAEAKLIFAGFDVGGGYEMLGADAGAQFRTPLATGHAFNGFADAFLAGPTTNGGPNGLQDFYAFVGTKLPWDVNARVWYHAFATADQMEYLGSEVDLVLSKKLSERFTVLFKQAWLFDANGYVASTGAPVALGETIRSTIQLEYKF